MLEGQASFRTLNASFASNPRSAFIYSYPGQPSCLAANLSAWASSIQGSSERIAILSSLPFAEHTLTPSVMRTHQTDSSRYQGSLGLTYGPIELVTHSGSLLQIFTAFSS